MLKIIQFIYGLHSGGAEELVKQYALLLRSRGHDVTVMLTGEREENNNTIFLEEKGIRLVYLGAGGAFCKIRRLQHFIEKEKPDIIHVHLNVLRYFLFVSLYGARIVYTVHNPPEIFFKHTIDGLAARILILRKKIKFIALQDEMKQNVDDYFSISDTTTLYNCIDVNRFKNARKKRQCIREELGIKSTDIVIGHIGRFCEQKNQVFLLDLFNEIEKIDDRYKLLCIGAGEQKHDFIGSVEALGLNHKVIVLSNRKDVDSLISAMDVFVFPSIYEGFGIALLEAQAEGVTCIVSDAVSEYVCVSEKFLRLPLDTPRARWINAVLHYEEINGAKHHNIMDYDVEAITDKLVSIYLEMIR